MSSLKRRTADYRTELDKLELNVKLYEAPQLNAPKPNQLSSCQAVKPYKLTNRTNRTNRTNQAVQAAQSCTELGWTKLIKLAKL